MPKHKGISCDIFINGEKAVEYGMEVSGSTCKVHIIGIEGAEYGFKLHFETGAARHDHHCFIDGQKALRRTDTAKAVEYQHAMVHKGNGIARKFKLRFGKIQTVEDKSEATEADASRISGLGLLEWRIWRAEIDKRLNVAPDTVKFSPTFGSVHEKQLKGTSSRYRTEFGPPENFPENVYKTTRLDPFDDPYAVIQFRYTSKEILQAEGLIPCTPSPEIVDKDVDEMDAAAMKREIMKLRKRARQGSLSSDSKVKREIKREVEREGDNRTPEVIDLENGSEEVGGKRRKVEVVDLSVDSD